MDGWTAGWTGQFIELFGCSWKYISDNLSWYLAKFSILPADDQTLSQGLFDLQVLAKPELTHWPLEDWNEF